jgi:hypothetical protein
MRLLAVTALALLAVGCGGGDRITETREVAPFDRVEVSDSVEVEVVPGDGRQVRVYAGEDVIDRVETESRDGVLNIDVSDRGIVIGDDPLGDARVEVALSALRGVRIDGSGDVNIAEIETQELELEVDGAGEIDAGGTADRLTARVQGAGDANLSELAVRRAVVVVEGAGDADLNVSDTLDVTIQGAGDVTYRGSPDIVNQEIDGAGEIHREGS